MILPFIINLVLFNDPYELDQASEKRTSCSAPVMTTTKNCFYSWSTMTTTAQQLAVQAKLDGIVAKTRSDLSLLASRHGQARKESKQIAPMSCTGSRPTMPALVNWIFDIICAVETGGSEYFGNRKDLSRANAGFKSLPRQLYFEFCATFRHWLAQLIQNKVGEEWFKSRLFPS